MVAIPRTVTIDDVYDNLCTDRGGRMDAEIYVVEKGTSEYSLSSLRRVSELDDSRVDFLVIIPRRCR